MPTEPTASLVKNANRVTATFALYFSLDDKDRRADTASFLSLISDLSLIAAAQEILTVIGHHLVERATDFVLDHSVAGCEALKRKFISTIRADKAGQRPEYAPSSKDADQMTQLVELATEALRYSPRAEVASALSASEIAIKTLVRTELKVSEAKAGEYAVAIAHEFKMTVKKK